MDQIHYSYHFGQLPLQLNRWQYCRCAMGVSLMFSLNAIFHINHFFQSNHVVPFRIYRLIFLSIYIVELILKVLARGFVLGSFTYLRDPWNCFDFAIIIIG